MTFKPKVTIIIPVFNGSNYLEKAIDSALGQTYENVEIIVVNDGSKDDGATERIAQSYGKRIRYYCKENGGVASAINLGIKKMTGEYFSWLSHDDLYYQDKIEKQIDFLAKLNFRKVFLYANYSILRDQQITPVIHNHEMLTRKKKYSLLRGCVNGITLLVPKAIIDEMGEFDEDLRCTQDYDYWRRIEAKYEFVHMQDVVSITRLHSEQDTQVSPNVVAEGDVLWIDMISKLPENEKIEYEGTLYNYYYEMAKFLESTPYEGALNYCKNELAKLEKRLSKEHFDPKVSIVIPFFNRTEQTLKAVETAISQTYKNTEIVMVNDGSTEDISGIEKLASKHKNVKLVSLKTNSGPATARNLGVERADGDYIAFLDSDDEFMPEKIEKQLSMMHKHNQNVSYTSYLRKQGDEQTLKCDPGLTGLVVPRIVSNCTIATPTVIVRKQFLIDHDLRFDESIRIGEDTRFWLEIAKKSEILLVNEPLTVVNVDETTHAQDSNKLVVGIKNLITYLLNDEYYSQYDQDIAVLCNYFFEINNDIREKESNRLLYEGPVVSVQPEVVELTLPKDSKIKAKIKSSIPYRATRMLYREGLAATVKAVINKKGD